MTFHTMPNFYNLTVFFSKNRHKCGQRGRCRRRGTPVLVELAGGAQAEGDLLGRGRRAVLSSGSSGTATPAWAGGLVGRGAVLNGKNWSGGVLPLFWTGGTPAATHLEVQRQRRGIFQKKLLSMVSQNGIFGQFRKNPEQRG